MYDLGMISVDQISFKINKKYVFELLASVSQMEVKVEDLQ